MGRPISRTHEPPGLLQPSNDPEYSAQDTNCFALFIYVFIVFEIVMQNVTFVGKQISYYGIKHSLPDDYHAERHELK
jgi:hypothetical protein